MVMFLTHAPQGVNTFGYIAVDLVRMNTILSLQLIVSQITMPFVVVPTMCFLIAV
jgi:hypothetical protein